MLGKVKEQTLIGYCFQFETSAVQNGKVYCKSSDRKIVINHGEVCPNRNGGCECVVTNSHKSCKGGQKCVRDKNEAVCIEHYKYFSCEGDGSWKCDNSKSCTAPNIYCERTDGGKKGKIVKSVPNEKVLDRKAVEEIMMNIMRRRRNSLTLYPARARSLTADGATRSRSHTLV